MADRQNSLSLNNGFRRGKKLMPKTQVCRIRAKSEVMPIKFRCKYCQQFLGIALSRAGAIVDCPKCGRSLQVPDPDGRAQRASESIGGASDGGDSDLLAALSELSALEAPTDSRRSSATSVPSQPEKKRPAASRVVKPAVPVTTSSIDPPTADAFVAADPHEDPLDLFDTLDSPDLLDPPGLIDPLDLDDPLQELAALSQPMNSPSSALSDELLSEMHRVSHPGAPLLRIFGGLLMLLIGGACGWWLAKSGTLPMATIQNENPDAAVVSDSPDDVDSPMQRPERAANDAAQQRLAFNGSVTYTDATGTQHPDSGALVMLLPLPREGTLKLDAQSLMQPSDHPDHKATLAALRQLEGDFAQADSTGRFQLQRPAGTDGQLIAISRHLQRPSDVSVASDVVAVLQNWFVSSSRMTGRLRVQLLQSPAASQNQDIVFRHTAGP